MSVRPDDYATVVRKHHHKTIGWLLAAGPPCTILRDDEIQRIDRDLRPLDMSDLQEWTPTGSWLLGVIVCPGDDLTLLAHRVDALAAADQDRVRLYVHPDVDLVTVLSPWYAAGLDDPRTEVVSDWKTPHPPFGRDLNDQVYKDAQAQRG